MADKILNGFDVWITAQAVKSRTRLRSIDNISLEGIGRLRSLILDFAICGKLVPQDSKEEPASVLVKRLSAQVTTKKNLLESIGEKEKFIDLPKGWEWVKLGSVGETNIGLTYSPTNISDSGTPVLRSSNIQNGKISYDDLVRVNGTIAVKNLVEQGDLLICARNGSKSLVGKCAIIPQLNEQTSFGAFMAIYRSEINEYVKLFLESPHYRSRLEGVSTTTINQITQDNLKNTVVPLPPFAEQHRIVAKVDELMALCDALEQQETEHLKSHRLLVETLLGTFTRAADAKEFQQAWNKLYEHFDDLFTTEDSIDQLKQTILQLAVMGKLVPQDPNDEPASELLKRIAKEKERLVEEGAIKREKALPDIQDSEIPFKVPSSWAFARLGEITNKIGSGSTPRGGRESYSDEGVLFLRSQNIYDYGLELSDVAFISIETHEKMSGTKVFPGDILLNITGGSLGRSTIFPSETGEANVSQHVTIIRPTNSNTRFFLHLCIMSPYGQELIWGRQVGANREGLSKRILELFEFPIPPLNEQNRIVSKIDELFALCDRLKERIAEAQRVANQMAEAVVEQVV